MQLADYFMIDTHCDTLREVLKTGAELRSNNLHLSLDRVKDFGGYVQFFAAWIDDKEARPLQEALQLLDTFYCEYEKNRAHMQLILTQEDLREALFSGKTGAILAVENGNALEGSLAVLRMLYRLGVRAVTLTWNGQNELGYGSMGENNGGLTEFGRAVVFEMNRLGMLIDVSHLSEQGFWDVLSISQKPVMASHSNARAVTEHKRNLTDDQICALIQTGGFIGLNLYPVFLSRNGRADLTDCLKHIEHMLELGAENILGLGSDFDGVESLPEGLSGPHEYIHLFDLLLQKGYSDSLIKKLTHENFLRFAEGIL